MSGAEKVVTSAETLVAAVADSGIEQIVVSGRLTDVPLIRLAPGQSLRGADESAAISFRAADDGVQLSTDNSVRNIRLNASPEKRAICNDATVPTLGRIELRGLTTTGRVQILVRDELRAGHVEVDGLDILAADARAETERPHGYGVYVLHGAFTLWNMQAADGVVISAGNMQAADGVVISADIVGISAGRQSAPVRGSGIFVGDAGDTGGRDGGIAAGTPDCISGGVFVIYGAAADLVRNRGPVTTYGANDMVLDNWGAVDRWIAEEKITSHGPSGIGFVNFGTVNSLQVNAPIETFGQGARGFNVYTGTVKDAAFERIVTHGDGAVGIQISQRVGQIKVRRGIETFGGTGKSLVKGVIMDLPAIALSVKAGGSARSIDIAGGAIAHGRGISPLELHGTIDELRITGGFAATGSGFDTI
jgi:hypothetical protein